MRSIEELLAALRGKYGAPVSWREILRQRYGQYGSNAVPEEHAGTNADTEVTDNMQAGHALFTYEEEHNRNMLGQLFRSCCLIEEYAKSHDQSGAVNSVEWRLIQKYKKELENLREGRTCSDSCKLSDKLSKILKKTLLKLWDYKGYSDIFHRYLKENGIEMECYEPGHKLTDDELCMLEEESIKAYSKSTADVSRKCEVIRMIQPVLHIGYKEDEDSGIEYKDICGICEFYL